MANNYIHTWTNAATGWDMKLIIVPYDSTLTGGTPVTLQPECVISAEETIVREWQELPVGLMNPHKWSVTLAFSLLPSALQTRLENGRDTSTTNLAFFGTDVSITSYKRNVFYLYSNRGSGSPTTLEYVGVQANVVSTDYETDYDVASNTMFTTATYDLVDSFYAACLLVNNTNLAAWMRAQATEPAFTDSRVFDVSQSGKTDAVYNTNDASFQAIKWSELETFIAGVIDEVLSTFTLRCGSVTTTLGASFSTAAVAMYQQDEPRAVGASLSSTSLYVIGTISSGGTVVGGFCSEYDSYGLAKIPTAWDWLKGMSETWACRTGYTFSESGGTVTVLISPERVVSSTVYTKAITDSKFETYKMTKGDAIARYAEVRYEAVDKDTNTTAFKYSNDASKGERSYTVQCLCINVPIAKRALYDAGGYFNVNDNSFSQTNLLFFKFAPGIYVKPHESTQIYYDASHYIDSSNNAVSNAPPNITSANSRNGRTLWNGWAVALQQTSGLPYGLAKFYATVFGDPNQVSYELTWPLAHGDEVMTAGVVHSITGMSHLTSVNFDRSIVLSVSIDWKTGTSKIKYITVID